MRCEVCAGDIKKGQYGIVIKAFITLTTANGSLEDNLISMEDGAPQKYAHYGCLMHLEPALVGIHIGEPLRD